MGKRKYKYIGPNNQLNRKSVRGGRLQNWSLLSELYEENGIALERDFDANVQEHGTTGRNGRWQREYWKVDTESDEKERLRSCRETDVEGVCERRW